MNKVIKKENAESPSKPKKDKFMTKINNSFYKLATQRHMVTIRDAFGIINPLIIAGAIALIGSIFLFGGSGGESTSILGWIAYAANGIEVDGNTWTFTGDWQTVSDFGANLFGMATDVTIGLFSIWIAFEIAYIFTVANKPKVDGIISGLMGLATFALFSHAFSGGNSMFMGASGILIAIISGFLSATIFSFFSRLEKLKIKMPKEVPPAISLGFSYIFPVLFTLCCVGLIDSFCWLIGDLTNWDIVSDEYNTETKLTEEVVLLESGSYGFSGLFFKTIGAPLEIFFSSTQGGLSIGLLTQFFVAIFWWFGINGSSVVSGFSTPILMALILQNTELVVEYGGYDAAEATGELSTINYTFIQNYSDLTGWGMTGGLIIATFLFSKTRAKREIAKLSSVPAVFNVNEPMTFGYPIMLNPIYVVPAILAAPTSLLIAFFVVDNLGWVRKSYLMVPWTLPPGIGAFLATGFDWRAIFLALFCLMVSVFLYIPFVFLDNKTMKIKEKKLVKKTKKVTNKKE